MTIKSTNPKVFGIGMWKTGTTSLEHALQQLGYKHSDNVKEFGKFPTQFLSRNVRAGFVNKGIPATHNYDYDNFSKEEESLIKNVMNKYSCFTDHPWMWCYKKAYEIYPDAKFILTLRKDDEALARSSLGYATRGGHPPSTCPTKKENFITRYRKHNEAVREFFNHNNANYLEVCFENGDGWKEICEFLDKPLPSPSVFPHSNRGTYKDWAGGGA